MRKTLQTNIAMNDSCDTRLCYTHTYRSFIAMLI